MTTATKDTTNSNGTEPRRLRARLVSITVALEVVADDGETLHLVDTQPVRLPANGWDGFHPSAALAEVQAQLDR